MSWLDEELKKDNKPAAKSWLDSELPKPSPAGSSWLDTELNQDGKVSLTPPAPAKTPIDQRLTLIKSGNKTLGDFWLGNNLWPAYKEDSTLAKIGKGVINYGLGTVANIFGAPQQSIMQADRAVVNAIKGKPQDFSQMNFSKDILGAQDENLLTMAIGTALDPATYIGGGIIDDLSKAGMMGKAATKGTTDNVINLGESQSKLIKVPGKPVTKAAENIPNKPVDDEVYQEIVSSLEGVKSNSDSFIKGIAPDIKDKSGISYDLKDPYRNFKDAFDKNFEDVKSSYLDPFDQAKKDYVNTIRQHTDEIYNKVVKDLDIQKGTKESAAVQWYGEKQRMAGLADMIDLQTGKKIKLPKMVEYTLDDLKKDFPESWPKIVEADSIFRKNYDELIDKINKSRESIYPNVEKEIAKVNDDIDVLKKSIQEEEVKRIAMEQGRPWQTNTEIILQNQLDALNKKKSVYQAKLDSTQNQAVIKKYSDMLSSVTKKIEIKEVSLSKAKLYGQPTAKQFKSEDAKIYRLTELLKKKEDLIKSDELWKNKRLQKRTDYYRHFNEMSGYSGLKNIFASPSQIDPKLAGISEFTKPKYKFASFFQRRGMGSYKADAVGGFLNYIPSASYAINIDPHISKFRGMAKDIAEGTSETKNANNFIKYLNDFSNSLAGKTNQYDRIWQEKVPGGRKAFAALNWVNSRVKSNQVLMNARSALSQLANIPVGIAKIKSPADMYKGMTNTFSGMIGKGKSPELYKQSQFISERYSNNLINRFNTKLTEQPEKFAAWIMSSADEIGTKFIWNSAYEQAIKDSAADAIKTADDITRSLVAGRGIGEVPLLQQSKTFQLVAPFQLEVSNLWHVMKDMISEKDFAGIAILLVGNYLFNEAAENLTGNRVVFDPINAVRDALQEDNPTPLKIAGRLGGEVLSNIPLGQTAATLFPEYNTTVDLGVSKINIPSRKELFGQNDPTRFGGGLLVTKALQDPLYKLALPFGGAQLKKTVEGLNAVNKGGDYSTNVAGEKSLKYPIEKTPGNYVQAGIFGKYSLPESKEYIDNDRRPLSPKQTLAYENSADTEMYNALIRKREIDALKNQIKEVLKDTEMDPDKKQKMVNELYGRLMMLNQ
jgi:hypothetical protein